MIREGCQSTHPPARLSRVLKALGIARSVWYAKRAEAPQKPGRKPKAVPEALAAAIRELARCYPWWGYKRIAVIARRQGLAVSNKVVYRVFKAAGLLQKPRLRQAALYQAAKLFELRIPRPFGHPFHGHSATDSTLIRPPIPEPFGH